MNTKKLHATYKTKQEKEAKRGKAGQLLLEDALLYTKYSKENASLLKFAERFLQEKGVDTRSLFGVRGVFTGVYNDRLAKNRIIYLNAFLKKTNLLRSFLVGYSLQNSISE